MEHLYFSVDLGGTSLRIGALDENGAILSFKTIHSDEVRQPDLLVARLVEGFHTLTKEFSLAEKNVVGASLGIPGLVDQQKGIILQSPHFPHWKNFSLKLEITSQVSFPIFIENDANQAALGEGWLGAGRQFSDFIMLTLGTGVGGGIILGGKVFHGSHGFAGEVGHIVIDREGLPGALGSKGTLETFTSLSGLRLQLKTLCKKAKGTEDTDPIFKLDLNTSTMPEALATLALKGNQRAQEVWKDFGKALACGIASLANTLGIFNFVIGGGLAGAWELFHPPCMEELPKRMYKSTAAMVQLVPAELGNQAGLIGGVPIIKQGLIKS